MTVVERRKCNIHVTVSNEAEEGPICHTCKVEYDTTWIEDSTGEEVDEPNE